MKKFICAVMLIVCLCVLGGCKEKPDLLLAGAEQSAAAEEQAGSAGTESTKAAGEQAGSAGAEHSKAAAAETAGAGTEDPAAAGGTSAGAAETPPEQAGIFVYICGAVKHPGVYELSAASRIYELVEKAGGMTKEANAEAINLAEPLTDGGMIRIPKKSEEGTENASSQDAAAESASSREAGAGNVASQDAAGGNGAGTGISADGRVNINTAAKEQLMTLTGIGESKAESIIAYRTKNGAFRTVDDIMKVEGIKEGTFEKIRDSITVQ